MNGMNRRTFVRTSVAAAASCTLDLGFLAQLSRTAAAEVEIDPDQVYLNAEIERLMHLIRSTPRDK
jgi:hypothetical protein